MALCLEFSEVCKRLGVERKSDGKLYFADGTECDVARALSSAIAYESSVSSSQRSFPDLPESIAERVRWI
ncbi:Uncharacterised protein [uncultured archaeon]|nr:Uncharacterised protein [uncultured archaeon]